MGEGKRLSQLLGKPESILLVLGGLPKALFRIFLHNKGLIESAFACAEPVNVVETRTGDIY